VTVSADGRAEIGEIQGISGALATAVRSQLQVRKFLPGQRNGVPVSGTARLSGEVLLTPAGSDDYVVRLEDVTLAARPRLLKAAAPLYPPAMFKEGTSATVEMALRIGTDGRVKEARTLSASHRQFEEAVRKALPAWRFEPGTSEVMVTLPVWFHTDFGRKPLPTPQFKCVVDVALPRIEGQSGCIDRVEVQASRVRRA